MGLGIFAGKNKSQPMAQQQPQYNALRIQSSVYGLARTIVYGQQRVTGNLIWYGDFKSIAVTSTQKQGGKGGNHGNGGNTTTTYTYSAAVAIALCEGPITGLYNVWDTKGKLSLVRVSETFTVPIGGGTYTVQNNANYYDDYGVSRQDAYSVSAADYGDIPRTLNGVQNTRMSRGAVAAGIYSRSGGGVYTFSAADAGKVVTITYVYSVPNSSNTSGQPLTQYSLSLFLGDRTSQAAWSYLTTAHPSQALAYRGTAYVADSAMDLGSSDSLPNLSFEVGGFLMWGAGITDCNPKDIIVDLLTSPFYGIGFPSGNIDALAQYSNYCIANSVFLSLVMDTQRSMSDVIKEILDASNSAAFYSENKLKILPYGDTTSVGNGTTYTPNTTPIYDLTDDDFQPNGDTAITITRTSNQDVINSTAIEWLNRTNDYNPEVVSDKDQNHIELYGLRAETPAQMHSITTLAAAQVAVNARLKRNVFIRNTYSFKTSLKYILLEPMDLVTLTDSSLGLNKVPARIVNMEEDEDGLLSFEAEEFPFGTAHATLYPKQATNAFSPQALADPGNVVKPVVFEPPAALSVSGQHELWIGVAGASQNLFQFSEQSDNAVYTKDGGSTVTANAALAPDGVSVTADILVKGAGPFTDFSELFQKLSTSAGVGNKVTYSVWLAVASGSRAATIAAGDYTTNNTFKSVTVTTTPQRVTVTSPTLAATGFIVGGVTDSGGTGSQLIVWGHQLEIAYSASTYVQTTSSTGFAANPNWGGCHVWMSVDGNTYTVVGTIQNPSRIGVLTSNTPAGSDPDTTNSFTVDLTQSAGSLIAGTKADADQFNDLCWIDGEFVSYQYAFNTAQYQYNVGSSVSGGAGARYSRRALFGSILAAHSIGTQFLRLDDAVFTLPYDAQYIGKTISLKFTSFNSQGLNEQNPANVIVYTFTLLGVYSQTNTLGSNLLINPGFETTTVSGAPLNTNLTVGGTAGDGWSFLGHYGPYLDGSPYFDLKIESGIGIQRSGSNNLVMKQKTGVTIPTSANFYQTTAVSDKVAVTPGQRYSFGAYFKADANAAMPAGCQGVAACRLLFYDKNGAFISELFANGEIDLGGAATGLYAVFGNFTVIPATVSGIVPAFIAVSCSSWFQNNSGGGLAVGANIYWDVRFDDVWLTLQNSLADDGTGKQGSSANTYTGALTYSSTTTSITWSWNWVASRTDLHLIRQNYNGSQAITGLPAGAASYNHYPFIDEVNFLVSMVATGGIGSPSWAHTGTNILWTQEQTRGDHYPLSGTPLVGSTVGSGTGSGSGGGVGGACLRHDMVVLSQRGMVKVVDLVTGDWVRCPLDEDTPFGWVEVTDVNKEHGGTSWVHILFNNDEWLMVTPGHPFTLEDGTMKRAANLCLEDMIPCTTGVCFPMQIRAQGYDARKVRISVKSKRHVFYAGQKDATVLQHNFMAVS